MQELIFTSSPRGLQVGKSGFCTVAASRDMKPGLIRMLESLSGYRHLFPPGTPEAKKNPVAYSYVRAKVGNDYQFILSRVRDCGVDYSGRSNKIAHHLSLDSNIQSSSPTRTLLEKGFFKNSWDKPAEILPPRSLPEKFSKPSPCHFWEKVTGDAGWAGELIESCQMNKTVYLIVKPTTPVMALIHQAISLLPAQQQWQYTFCTFYRRLPPNVDCQIRCVMEGSNEMELTRQSTGNVLIDLTAPLGKSLSCWAENARQGTLIEGQRPNVEALPLTSAPAPRKPLRDVLPSAMPDLRGPRTGPPGLKKIDDEEEEEELDVLEIEPAPLWKRLLVASIIALVVSGIASVVIYPDFYRGLLSFSFLSSKPNVSRFASELPPDLKASVDQRRAATAPAVPNPADADPATVGVAPADQAPADQANANGDAVETVGAATPPEAGANQSAIDPSRAAGRNVPVQPQAQQRIKPVVPLLPRGAMARAESSSSNQGLTSELPNQSANAPTAATTQPVPADSMTNSTAAAEPAGFPVAPDSIEPEEVEIPEVKPTLITLQSIADVSFDRTWELIEPRATAIPVLNLRHAPQKDLGIRLQVESPVDSNSYSPEVVSTEIDSRTWDVSIEGRPTGQFRLVESDSGTVLEFHCHLDRDQRPDVLTDDIDVLNRIGLVVEFDGGLKTRFPLNVEFVHANAELTSGNRPIRFNGSAKRLDDLLEDETLRINYDVYDLQAETQGTNTPVGDALTQPVAGARYDAQPPAQEEFAVVEQIDFPLALESIAYDQFSDDERQRLIELNARLQLRLVKVPNKPLKHQWTGFFVDVLGFRDVKLQSWRFVNHPLTVIRRDLTKRKSALRDSPAAFGGNAGPAGSNQVASPTLIEQVESEIDFLNRIYTKTARTQRIDGLLPGRVPFPIEIRTDGQFVLMYIDVGDSGTAWSKAEMRQAYHGSPVN